MHDYPLLFQWWLPPEFHHGPWRVMPCIPPWMLNLRHHQLHHHRHHSYHRSHHHYHRRLRLHCIHRYQHFAFPFHPHRHHHHQIVPLHHNPSLRIRHPHHVCKNHPTWRRHRHPVPSYCHYSLMLWRLLAQQSD